MRVSTILPTTALLASALASTSPHAAVDLLARAIDPATMDPTKLSVLSVLKTAMPTATGTDIVLPTGTTTPQWYKDLPADVMVLLAQMYPATATASPETASVSVSQTTLSRTLELVPTDTASSNASISASSSNRVSTNAAATLSSGAPSATQSSFSTGAKNSVGTEKWSIAMGFGVAAVFCFFA